MPEEIKKVFSEHGAEVGRSIFNGIIAVVLGLITYVWVETTADIRADVTENRAAINRLGERITRVEVAAEGNRQLQLSVVQRIDRMERWIDIPAGGRRREGN